ncbi:lactonase family protein [Actinomadura madurae]|uniref:lactonase family protein n=1 Tax=Actinomadura madurae TaxID=1993 RepID=UPI0020D2454A|nr:beta-propeller fold lactonase family protein [Actinomadura madurae]MCP9968549.1 lactonase family protein [Actinomadura madurae]
MRRLARDRVAIDAAIGLLTAAAVVAPLSEAGPADAAADPSRATENRSAASPGGRTAYVTNSANVGGTANVTRFSIGATGALTPVDAVALGDRGGARSMVFTPDLRFAYLANTRVDRVVRFRIGPGGALERLGEVETPGPFAMAIAPDGKTIYVSNAGTRMLSPFTVGRGGELKPLRPVDTGAEVAKGVSVTPDGRFVYVSHGSPSDTTPTVMTGFALRSNGSVGREVARKKIGISGAETVITPDGRFVYVVNQGSNNVHGFRIGVDGALTPVPNSPVDGGDFPEGAGISPDGRGLYVAAVGVEGNDPDARAGQVLSFTIGDDGRLTEKPRRVTMASPIGIGFSADGRHLYVSDYTESIVNAFAVAPDGTLDLIQTAASNGPRPAFHSINVLPSRGTASAR